MVRTAWCAGCEVGCCNRLFSGLGSRICQRRRILVSIAIVSVVNNGGSFWSPLCVLAVVMRPIMASLTFTEVWKLLYTCVPNSEGVCIYIYTYIYAVELLSGPSLGVLNVIIWSKFVFYKHQLSKKTIKIGVSALFFWNNICAHKFLMLLSGPIWRFLRRTQLGPDNNTWLGPDNNI